VRKSVLELLLDQDVTIREQEEELKRFMKNLSRPENPQVATKETAEKISLIEKKIYRKKDLLLTKIQPKTSRQIQILKNVRRMRKRKNNRQPLLLQVLNNFITPLPLRAL